MDGRKYRLNVVEFNSLTRVRICSQFTLHIRKLSVRWVTTVCCVANFEAGINTLLANLKVGGAKGRGVSEYPSLVSQTFRHAQLRWSSSWRGRVWQPYEHTHRKRKHIST